MAEIVFRPTIFKVKVGLSYMGGGSASTSDSISENINAQFGMYFRYLSPRRRDRAIYSK